MEKNNSAFTMIETIIVLGIIGILVTIGIFSFSISAKTSRDATRRADLESISGVLEDYNNKYGTYPINDNELRNYYSNNLKIDEPKDPKTKVEYSYSPVRCIEKYQVTTCPSYILSTTMELTNTTYSVDKYGVINND
jgi:prepilin-type N-terminal cleavage/methylation domain-containing protein